MRRLFKTGFVVFGVAFVVFGSALLPAQEPKAEPEQAREKTVVEKRAIKVEKKAMEEKAEIKVEAVRVAPAIRLGPAVAVGGEALGENDPQVLQWMQQLRPYVRSEFQVVLTVCEPTDEQRRKLAGAFDGAVRDLAKLYLERQRQPRQNSMQGEPDELVRKAVAATVKPLLTSEQSARYEADIQERDAIYKQTAARGVVTILDTEMHLSPDQREEIGKALAENWNDSWMSSVRVLQYGLQFFPNIPDQYIRPSLDEAQKKIWDAIPRNHNISFGLSVELDNEPLEDALRAGTGKDAPAPDASNPAVPADSD